MDIELIVEHAAPRIRYFIDELFQTASTHALGLLVFIKLVIWAFVAWSQSFL
jgi:hypothetical protein